VKAGKALECRAQTFRQDAGKRRMKDLKYETLALEQPAEHLLIVRFNRPEVSNAI